MDDLDEGRLWLGKHTPAGDLVWAKTVVHPMDTAVAWDVAVGPSGQVAVAGYFFTDNAGVKPGSDIYVGLHASDGTPLWSDLYDSGPGKTYDRADGVVIDGFGNVLVVGRIQKLLGQLNHGHVRKYTGAGALICERTLDITPGMHTALRGATLGPGGAPRVVGWTGDKLYVAGLTP